jgi:hypothetical protein
MMYRLFPMLHASGLVCAVVGLVASRAQAQIQQREIPLTPLPFPEIDEPVLSDPGLPLWLLVGGAIGLLVLAGVLVWVLVFAKKPPVAVLVVPPLRKAMDRLQAVSDSLDDLSPADVGHEVSTILRDYQQERYAVPAPYLTSEELFGGDHPPVKPDVQGRFGPLAQVYDRLAFARIPATRAEAETLIHAAVEALQEERRYGPGTRGAEVSREPGTPPPLPTPVDQALDDAPKPLSLEKSEA